MKLDNTIKNPTQEDLARSLKNKKNLNDLLDKAIKHEREKVAIKGNKPATLLNQQAKTKKPLTIDELPNPFEDSTYKTD